jgi:hypothetical protein
MFSLRQRIRLFEYERRNRVKVDKSILKQQLLESNPDELLPYWTSFQDLRLVSTFLKNNQSQFQQGMLNILTLR